MAASAVMDPHPQTLTDSRNDITTQGNHIVEGLLMKEVVRRRPGTIELTVISGSLRRRIEFSIPHVPAPKWLIPALTGSSRLLLLAPNWDEEGAQSIEPAYIQIALEALYQLMAEESAIPQWTPTRDGGVQMDWHENGIDLEIEFAPQSNGGYAVFSDQEGQNADWDGAVKSNVDQLRRIFAERLAH